MRSFKLRYWPRRVRDANGWADEMLLALTPTFIKVGLVMGTLDVFNHLGLSVNPSFTLAWSIIQSLAIDGLLFAVLGRFAVAIVNLRQRWAEALTTFVVAVPLAVVCGVVNNIVTYQEVNQIVDSVTAMHQLHIPVDLFTTWRSIIFIIVAVLIQLFCRAEARDNAKLTAGNSAQPGVGTVNVILNETQRNQQQQLHDATSNNVVNARQQQQLPVATKKQQVNAYLDNHPYASNKELMLNCGVDKSQVSRIRAERSAIAR